MLKIKRKVIKTNKKRIDAYEEANTLGEYEFIELCSNVEKEEIIQFLDSQKSYTIKRP